MKRIHHSEFRSPILALLSLLILFLVCSAPCAVADTIRVAKDGTGDYSTLQEAIAASSEGDRIEVGPGTYSETEVGEAGVQVAHSLEIIATSGPEDTIIDGDNVRRGFLFSGGQQSSVEGISFLHCYHNDIGSGITVTGGAHVLVVGCTFAHDLTGYQGGAVHVRQAGSSLQVLDSRFSDNKSYIGGAGTCIQGANLSFEDCLFEKNMGSGSFGTVAANASHLVVDGCTFAENYGPAGTCVNYYEAGGKVVGSTFYRNDGGAASVRVDAPSSAILVARNVFYGEQEGFGLLEYGGTIEECNLYYQNSEGDHYPFLGPDEITADPLFCDADNLDFRVSANSPAAPSNNECGVQLGSMPVGCESMKSIELALSNAWGGVQDTVAVSLTVETADENVDISVLAGLDLDLTWDGSAFELLSVEVGEDTRGWSLASNISEGAVRVSMAGLEPLYAQVEKREVLQLRFLILSEEGERAVRFASSALYDQETNLVPHSTRDGAIVTGCAKGDVVEDGEINSADAIRTLQIAAQLYEPSPREFCAADRNLNGEIDPGDAVLILRMAVGLDAEASKAPQLCRISLHATATGVEIIVSGAAGLSCDLAFDSSGARLVSAKTSEGVLVSGPNRNGSVSLYQASAQPAEISIAIDFDINSPTVVRLNKVIAFDTAGMEEAVEAGEAEVLLTNSDHALKRTVLHGAYPNPFNPRTEIRFSWAGNGSGSLSIYDARGRMVRQFQISGYSAGEQAIIWDGLDGSGYPLSSGIYRIRLHSVSGDEVTSAVLLK